MKIKLSLLIKTRMAVVFIAFVLACVTVYISYLQYTYSFEEHYKERAMQVAYTASDLVDKEKALHLREQVMEIYRQNPASEWETEEEYDAYMAQYRHLQDETHDEILELLENIKENNNVLYLYLGYLDKETMTAIYLVDADDSEFACPTGTWDFIYPDNYGHMETEEQIIPAFATNTVDFGYLSSAGVPVMMDNGEIACHVFVDISMDEVAKSIKDFMYISVTTILVYLTIALFFVNKWIKRILVEPINMLSSATSQYVSEHTDMVIHENSAISQLNIKTGDEIEFLADSIQMMERDIRQYLQSLTEVYAEKQRLGAELNVATNIQASMMPNIFPAFPERMEFDLYATMTPAKEVGGDFYDYFFIDEDHLVLNIADVSGKGVPAALFMVITKTLLKNAAQNGFTPKEILETVNKQLCENNDTGMFVTVWVGILEISTGKLTCASAGHEYPVLKRAGASFEIFKDKHGFVLAGMEMSKYQQYELQLYPEDVLYLYTDGVAEATNGEEELFGASRMLMALNGVKTTDPEHLLHQVSDEVAAFVGEAPQFDDITMLAIRYKPAVSKKSKITPFPETKSS